MPMLTFIMALAAAPQATPARHVLTGAFGVEFGVDAGDMRAKGWDQLLKTDGIWDRDGDGFFDQVMVHMLPERNAPLQIMATRFYRNGDKDAQMAACRSGMDAIRATLRSKYPSLRERSAPVDLGPEWEGTFGKTVTLQLAEPTADLKAARRVEIECAGRPTGQDGAQKPTQLNIVYKISEAEVASHNAYLRARQDRRDRERGRSEGLKADEL